MTHGADARLDGACPDACQVKLRAICRDIDELKTTDEKHWDAIGTKIHDVEQGMEKRAKTTTIIALAVIAIGIFSGILSAMWMQTNAIARKVDTIREEQVKVVTTLSLHMANNRLFPHTTLNGTGKESAVEK